MRRPVLFVDVDGVISLFGFPPDSPPEGRFLLVDGITHLLSAGAGPRLRRLARSFEPVWCTGWEERADEHLPHALALGARWPWLSFDREPRVAGAHWKLGAIERHVGAGPLAWVDDAHDERCRAWARRRSASGAPTLLLTTDPAIGLTDDHVGVLTTWADELSAAGRAGAT